MKRDRNTFTITKDFCQMYIFCNASLSFWTILTSLTSYFYFLYCVWFFHPHNSLFKQFLVRKIRKEIFIRDNKNSLLPRY